MTRGRLGHLLRCGMLAICLGASSAPPGWAQAPTPAVDQPDAQRTRRELSFLLSRYPPSLRVALSIDPTLLGNQQFLGPYPVLVNFLTTHPEIAHNPAFYIEGPPLRGQRDTPSETRSEEHTSELQS